MKRVAVTELLSGMVLAKAVTNTSGLPVVPVGVEINNSIIERLKQLGLTSVFIEGDSGDTTGKTLAELEAELDHRFHHVIQDPLQTMIHRQIREHLRATHGIQQQKGSADL